MQRTLNTMSSNKDSIVYVYHGMLPVQSELMHTLCCLVKLQIPHTQHYTSYYINTVQQLT